MSKAKLVADGFKNPRQAAEFLGTSRSRIYELVAARVLSHAYHGNRIAIPVAALRAYAAERVVQGSVA